MVARSTKNVALVLLALLALPPACAPGGSNSTSASDASDTNAWAPTLDASTADSSTNAASDTETACTTVGPYDAAAYTFRASCTYALPSEAGAFSACDEWSQSGVNDWGVFIEGCIQDNGTLSAQPCVSTGQVGRCVYPASCTGQIATYFYGAPGAASFEQECVATEGAAWSPI